MMENKVELLGYYGGDETHALSAWTSTARELTEERKTRMDKMLSMLAKNGHHTPFEKSYLHFLVTCDTASHIHIIKHRIGVSVNTESARYKEFTEDKIYIPSDWPVEEQEKLRLFSEKAFETYHETVLNLENKGYSRKRAKESARFYLPYSSQVTMDVGFNFRSFMHFQGLRNSEHAQMEICNISKQMLELVKNTGAFTLSLKAFKYV